MSYATDPRYIRFLALHPGIWPEVGALDDKPFLAILRAERCSLGLAPDRWAAEPPPSVSQTECAR